MPRRIAVFGGSFNPPGAHHRTIAEELSRHFDEVVVVPCGPRPDKATVGYVEPIHRAIMTDLAFRGLPKVRVDSFDLEQKDFTRNHRLEEMFGRLGEVWHVVGTDLVRDGNSGRSEIHRKWEKGDELWERLNFAVVARQGYDADDNDLPPRHRLFIPARSGSSSEIRERVFKRLPLDGLTPPQVSAHIERYGLYQGAMSSRTTMFDLKDPRPFVVADERNGQALRLADRLGGRTRPQDADSILVIGGDGTMIRAIRDHWRLRLPFLGVNAGHRGYLMNDAADVLSDGKPSGIYRTQMLPLFYVEAESADGRSLSAHAINDAWVERAGGQAAWLRVSVDGQVRLPRLVCDGALVSTAAGSTAYARAMGATPLLADAAAFLLVGSNVSEPLDWKSAQLPLDAEVDMSSLNTDKRPVRAFVDGQDMGCVTRMAARISRTAAVELVFSRRRDLASKLAEGLFPAHRTVRSAAAPR